MSKSDNSTPEFTGLRARLWPIHAHELKKFIPLGIIMFCLLFNYTILQEDFSLRKISYMADTSESQLSVVDYEEKIEYNSVPF